MIALYVNGIGQYNMLKQQEHTMICIHDLFIDIKSLKYAFNLKV